jgi:hypothetical protein
MCPGLPTEAFMDANDVLVEVTQVFAAQVGLLGGSIDPEAAVTLRVWFDRTIGPAIKADSEIWEEPGHSYAVRQVERIAAEAWHDAEQESGGRITDKILDKAVGRVIKEQQKVCVRLSARATPSSKLGAFCKLVK